MKTKYIFSRKETLLTCTYFKKTIYIHVLTLVTIDFLIFMPSTHTDYIHLSLLIQSYAIE